MPYSESVGAVGIRKGSFGFLQIRSISNAGAFNHTAQYKTVPEQDLLTMRGLTVEALGFRRLCADHYMSVAYRVSHQQFLTSDNYCCYQISPCLSDFLK